MTKIEWWLMDCSLPDLNWARVRVLSDGTADVFDSDGRLESFPAYDDAANSLAEDEFVRLANLADLEQDELLELPAPIETIAPPSAASDEQLRPLMYQEWVADRRTWRPRAV